jgi:hypothetical protein
MRFGLETTARSRGWQRIRRPTDGWDRVAWAREQKSLCEVGPGFPQHSEFIFRFHAFYYDLRFEVTAQRNYAANELSLPLVFVDTCHQVAVELDHAGFEIGDAFQVRVPSTEVIDYELDVTAGLDLS